MAYNGRTLEPFWDGEFRMDCQPNDLSIVEPEALDVTGKTIEQIKTYPRIELVWPQFVSWVGRWNKKGNEWDAPIPCGANIIHYDLVIAKRMNEMFGHKKKDTILFNTFKRLDLMDDLFRWFENSNELKNFKADTWREYFGLSKDGLHSALSDAKNTGLVLMRLLKYQRKLMEKRPTLFKNAFSEQK